MYISTALSAVQEINLKSCLIAWEPHPDATKRTRVVTGNKRNRFVILRFRLDMFNDVGACVKSGRYRLFPSCFSSDMRWDMWRWRLLSNSAIYVRSDALLLPHELQQWCVMIVPRDAWQRLRVQRRARSRWQHAVTMDALGFPTSRGFLAARRREQGQAREGKTETEDVGARLHTFYTPSLCLLHAFPMPSLCPLQALPTCLS